MQSQDIEQNLTLLGKWLEKLDVHTAFRLLMIGGGFMLTQVGSRNLTEDVDVLIYDFEKVLLTKDFRHFKLAVKFVAEDNDIKPAWLSHNIGEFLEMAGPLPKVRLWRTFGSRLKVYVPPKSYILAHKLVAGRQRDRDDIGVLLKQLHITSWEQAHALVERYITDDYIREGEGSKLFEMLDRFFP